MSWRVASFQLLTCLSLGRVSPIVSGRLPRSRLLARNRLSVTQKQLSLAVLMACCAQTLSERITSLWLRRGAEQRCFHWGGGAKEFGNATICKTRNPNVAAGVHGQGKWQAQSRRRSISAAGRQRLTGSDAVGSFQFGNGTPVVVCHPHIVLPIYGDGLWA